MTFKKSCQYCDVGKYDIGFVMRECDDAVVVVHVYIDYSICI